MVPLMGVQVENVMFEPDFPKTGPRPTARVTAVQEGGPAYMAGVAPGDVIYRAGNQVAVRAELLPVFVERGYRPGNRMQIVVYYFASGSSQPKSGYFTLDLREPGQGRGISQVPVHTLTSRTLLPGVEAGRNGAKTQYAEAKKQALSAILKDPCNTVPADINRMAKELKVLAELLRWEIRATTILFGKRGPPLAGMRRTAVSPLSKVPFGR